MHCLEYVFAGLVLVTSHSSTWVKNSWPQTHPNVNLDRDLRPVSVHKFTLEWKPQMGYLTGWFLVFW